MTHHGDFLPTVAIAKSEYNSSKYSGTLPTSVRCSSQCTSTHLATADDDSGPIIHQYDVREVHRTLASEEHGQACAPDPRANPPTLPRLDPNSIVDIRQPLTVDGQSIMDARPSVSDNRNSINAYIS